MGEQKQFTRPSKKQKPKASAPETADDFQEAANREEEAGGKHRAGDPTKSGRAFLRALDTYDKALHKYPTNFDLAYNKARLQFEIAQHPALVDHVGLRLIDLLKLALESHRYALRLNEENPDILFNTSNVLTSLAEQWSEIGSSPDAIPLLQEALELLSACLSRQEMLLEQQKIDFEDAEEGGVQLDPDEKPASTSASDVSEQTALVETPITASDLLDTVHASLSALTTLIPLAEKSALQMYCDMAQALTESRAPSYLSLLPADLQDQAHFGVGLDRAIFIAAFADAQYSFYMIELETHLNRLDSFDIPGKEDSSHALSAEAEARMELVLSALDRFAGSPDLPADICWKQLSLAQELYTKATKLNTEDAKERKAEVYKSKGDLELVRHRLVSTPASTLSDTIRRSAPTLVSNAQTYYKGSAQLAKADGNSDVEIAVQQRWLIAADIGAFLYGADSKPSPFEGSPSTARGDLMTAFEACVDEGVIDMALGHEIMERMRQ